MPAPKFALFDTAIGRCGVAWGEQGVVSLQLPEASDAATRQRLLDRFPDARLGKPPVALARQLAAIQAHLRGEAADLSRVELDMGRLPEFQRRVYQEARKIPSGATLSYGELAERAGCAGGARAVGQAMGKNPFAPVVPCHRVLAARGKIGGFSANGGVATKQRLLAIERARGNVDSPLFGPPAGARGFQFDPTVALEHLRERDAGLRRLIERVGPFHMQLKSTRSVFAALAESIVYQQLNGRAAATIFGRVQALFPELPGGLTPQQILEAPDAKLRAAGLSRNKLASLKDLAERTAAGEIPDLRAARRLSDDAIIERLTKVRGIGRWTVEMLLIFRLGRPDVLPVDDYGIKKGFMLAFKKPEMPTKQELARRGRRWSPYSSVASWYLWRATDLADRETVSKQAEKTARRR